MTNKEIAAAARAALQQSRQSQTPQAHAQRLISLGWVDEQGRVTTRLGGSAQPVSSANQQPSK